MCEPVSGKGRCRAEAQLSIRASCAAVELGALSDVIHAVLNAAHHANRHGDPDDMLAVALPDLHLHRSLARPGREVVLFGSEASLRRFLDLDGVRLLVRRGMVAPLDLIEAWPEAGTLGTAYMRDRSVARRSKGALRRARARAERRGVDVSHSIEVRPPDPAILALHYGSAVIHVREKEAFATEAALLVSTYGFSSPEAPAVLPIRSDRKDRWTNDAA